MKKFFNNLGKAVENLFDKAQGAVETGCERFALQRDITAHQNELEKLFAELGRFAYHGNACVAGVRDAATIRADIANISSNLQSLEEELEELSEKGAAEDAEVVEEEPVLTGKRYCHKCGTPQPEGNDFCHKCGTKIQN